MTDSNELELQYLGEPSPRRPLTAFVLGLICPGLGWVYQGRLGFGLLVNFGAVALWAAFVAVWTARKFFPSLPLGAFAAGWLVLVAMAALDAALAARREGAEYVLRDTNHALVYAAVFTFSFALPLGGIYHVALHDLWRVVPVADQSMYPTLVAGDRVLVDVAAFRGRSPAVGEIVLYEEPGDDGATHFGRIVALPGSQVVVGGETVFVDDAPSLQRPIGNDELSALLSVAGAVELDVAYLIESHGDVVYPVVTPQASLDAGPAAWEVDQDAYFLLNDNRADIWDSRTHGPVPRSSIVGRPVFVGYSLPAGHSDGLPFAVHALARVGRGEDGFRSQREGRRVQSPEY